VGPTFRKRAKAGRIRCMLDVVGFDAAAPQVIGDFITAGATLA
jgi:hypothetical protein